MELLIISLITIALFVTGTPILILIAGWVAATSYFVVELSLANMGVAATESIRSFVFLAVPLFVATGDLLTEGGISKKLVAFARSCVTWLPGATTCSAIFASGLFAAISGSNSATAATMGRMLGPEMEERGIKREQAAAIIAAAGTVGVIIPPSVIFIIYGVTLNVSAVDLFVAGVLPGLVLVLLMLIVGAFVSRHAEPAGGLAAIKPKDIIKKAGDAWLGFIAIATILFGVGLGWYSPTEAAGVVTLFAIFAGIVITRKLGIRALPRLLLRSAGITGMIVPLVCFSIMFQQVLAVLGASEAVQSILLGIGEGYGPLAVILLMMAAIIVIGALTESVAVVLILGPMLAPIAVSVGFDPVHWGVIFVVGTAIGFVTPPYGLNLFVVSAVCDVPFAKVMGSIGVMLSALFVGWGLIVAFPWLSLGLL